MEEILKGYGVGLRAVNDPFFDDSYRVCKVFERKGITVEDEELLCHKVMQEFPCNAPKCNATFQTLLDYEMHYNSFHRYICTECKTSRPSPRLLEIHIQETHDSFFKLMCKKQPMYQCFVSDCDLKFIDPLERKEHCVSVHKFPKNYRFDSTSHSKKDKVADNVMEIDQIDKAPKEVKPSKVRLNKNQKCKMFTPASCKSLPTAQHSAATTSTSSATNSSSLLFIPRQLQKSYSKALTRNENKEKNVLEESTMMDLTESLPT